MPLLTLLGTGAALSDAIRENTYLVVQGNSSAILVDCAGSPTQRLLRAGVELDSLDHIVLTHHHPDHIYGLSVLLLDLWLAGRRKKLHIHGLTETLRAARGMMHAFEWERWREHGFFDVEFHTVPKKGINLVLKTGEVTVKAILTKHLLPTIALRFESSTGRSIAYTSDTTMVAPIVTLACDADILIHESTTVDEPTIGHSSARQAGEQAHRARVKELILVHLPPDVSPNILRTAAESTFKGKVVVGKDFMRIRF